MIGHWMLSYETSSSQLEGREEVEPIEPLVESEPLGLIWSVNEIEDFRNHINDLKEIYNKNLERDEIPVSNK